MLFILSEQQQFPKTEALWAHVVLFLWAYLCFLFLPVMGVLLFYRKFSVISFTKSLSRGSVLTFSGLTSAFWKARLYHVSSGYKSSYQQSTVIGIWSQSQNLSSANQCRDQKELFPCNILSSKTLEAQKVFSVSDEVLGVWLYFLLVLLHASCLMPSEQNWLE